MKNRIRAASTTTPESTTKLTQSKDIIKVYEYFRYKTGTTSDCSKATNVKRNSITWYVTELERLKLLVCVCIGFDSITHRKVKFYSANPSEMEQHGKEVCNE